MNHHPHQMSCVLIQIDLPLSGGIKVSLARRIEGKVRELGPTGGRRCGRRVVFHTNMRAIENCITLSKDYNYYLWLYRGLQRPNTCNRPKDGPDKNGQAMQI